MVRRPRPLVLLAALVAVLVPASLATACEPPPPGPPSFIFTGSGWGHGVGMSQRGAAGLAAHGSQYRDILAWYYTGTTLQRLPQPAGVRVLVAEGRSSVTLGSSAPLTVTDGVRSTTLPPGSTTLSPSGPVLAAGGLSGTSLRFDSAAPVSVSGTGHSYLRGDLTVSVHSGTLSVVVGGLTMQEYLYGLGEMPSSWPAEALRAQAVAGRSFAKRTVETGDRGARHFDLYASVRHQSYVGWEKESEGSWSQRWRDAVDATDGQTLTYGGQVATTVYSASSGGHTESAAYVWGGEVPYLQPRVDPYDDYGANPDSSWSRTVTAERLGALLGVGVATSVRVEGTSVSGRTDRATVTVAGTRGTARLTGSQLRARLNADGVGLRSTRFTVTSTR